jgi:hypothetical protein
MKRGCLVATMANYFITSYKGFRAGCCFLLFDHYKRDAAEAFADTVSNGRAHNRAGSLLGEQNLLVVRSGDASGTQ